MTENTYPRYWDGAACRTCLKREKGVSISEISYKIHVCTRGQLLTKLAILIMLLPSPQLRQEFSTILILATFILHFLLAIALHFLINYDKF